MMKMARWILPVAAALFLVPCIWADAQVVGIDGTVYSIQVSGSAGPTALSYSVLHPDGTLQTGTIAPSGSGGGDRDPILVLAPGASTPFLIWTRNDGGFDQIAYSRFVNQAWAPPQYMTSGPRDHVRPQTGIDAHGSGYLVWVEAAGQGAVMFATFDPLTGSLALSPRDLVRELARFSPPEWLSPGLGPSIDPVGAGKHSAPIIQPDGGNDTPAIPPCSSTQTTNCKKDALGGATRIGPACTKAVAAAVVNRSLAIGILDSGAVEKYYRSVIPVGAPDNYVTLLLQSLLDQHCQQ
jgi:hypothetical protein